MYVTRQSFALKKKNNQKLTKKIIPQTNEVTETS